MNENMEELNNGQTDSGSYIIEDDRKISMINPISETSHYAYQD